MTICQLQSVVGPCSAEDLERMSLSLTRAYPALEIHRFGYLLTAIDEAEEEAACGDHIASVSQHPFG